MINLKITSFNTLYYGYSNGQTSIRDQILGIQHHFEQELADVTVLFEMPNPHVAVNSDTLMTTNALWELEDWLRGRGYGHIRQLDDKLSVWVVSRHPLKPLLLLGSSTVNGAIKNLFDMTPDPTGVATRIDKTSSYPVCLRSAIERDRSTIVGVQFNGRILPLIALHAKCLFFNPRFGRLLIFFLRAFVAQKGIVVTDINFSLDQSFELLDDPLFKAEIDPTIIQRLRDIPLGSIHSGESTAISVSYPYARLAIDTVIGPPHPAFSIRIGGDKSACIPNLKYSSDHQYIVISCLPSDWFLDLEVDDVRNAVLQWSLSHPHLTEIYYNRLPFPFTMPVYGNAGLVTPSLTSSLAPIPIESSPGIVIRDEPPKNKDDLDAIPLDEAELEYTNARRYLGQNFPRGTKICHQGLKAGLKCFTSTNSYGPSCHPKCVNLHDLKNHPILHALIGRDNTANVWRDICAFPQCSGIHNY